MSQTPFAWFLLTSCIAASLGYRRVINGSTNYSSIERNSSAKVLVSASVHSFRNEQPPKMFHENNLSRVEEQYNRLVSNEVGKKEWRTMVEAGWTKDKIVQARQLSEYEGMRVDFLGDLLGKVVYDGTRKWASFNEHWENPQFYDFSHPTPSYMLRHFYNQRDLYEDYLNQGVEWHAETELWVRNGCKQKKAVFVLGPSSVGKTSSLATIAATQGQFDFPAMSYDGADWREVSKVWRKFAKESPFLLTDYYDKVFQKAAKPKLKEVMEKWITRFAPCTVFRPTTAAKHANAAIEAGSKVLGKGKGIHGEIEFFERLGYEIHFVGITGPKAKVELFGQQRAAKEGKQYDRSGFDFALKAMKTLSKTYRKYRWSFYLNSFEKEEELREFGGYEELVAPAVSSKKGNPKVKRTVCSCDESGTVQGGITCKMRCYCRMTYHNEYDIKGMFCPDGDR